MDFHQLEKTSQKPTDSKGRKDGCHSDIDRQNIKPGAYIQYTFVDSKTDEKTLRIGRVDGFSKEYKGWYQNENVTAKDANYISITQAGHGIGSNWISLGTIENIGIIKEGVRVEITKKNGAKIYGIFAGLDFHGTDNVVLETETKKEHLRAIDIAVIKPSPKIEPKIVSVVENNLTAYSSKRYKTFMTNLEKPHETVAHVKSDGLPEKWVKDANKLVDNDGRNLIEIIGEISSLCGVNANWIMATMWVENPDLKPTLVRKNENGTRDVGLMQVNDSLITTYVKDFSDDIKRLADSGKIDLDGLAKLLGIEGQMDGKNSLEKVKIVIETACGNKKEINENIVLGTLMLRMNLERFRGSYELSSLAYNSGRNGVVRHLEGSKMLDDVRFAYPSKVSKYRQIIESLDVFHRQKRQETAFLQ